MSRSQYDISVFSPEGNLYQVQYAIKCLSHEKLTNVALRGKDCAVVICQKKVPDKLMKAESISHLFWITKKIGVAVCGRVPDCAQVVEEARHEAGKFYESHGYECDATWMGKRLAEMAQVYTQRAGLRPLGCGSIIFAMEADESSADYELVPKLYTVVPHGICLGHIACSLGEKENEVRQVLEKQVQEKSYQPSSSNLDDTIMCGIQALQKSLGANDNNLTAADLEICVVTKDNPNCRKIDSVAVEEYITKIVERDEIIPTA